MEGVHAGAMAGKIAMLPDNQSRKLDTLGLKIVLIDAVVANHWISKGHQLTCVGRVGQHFLVAGHTSIKNYFAVSKSWTKCLVRPILFKTGRAGSKGLTGVNRPVLQHQIGF